MVQNHILVRIKKCANSKIYLCKNVKINMLSIMTLISKLSIDRLFINKTFLCTEIIFVHFTLSKFPRYF